MSDQLSLEITAAMQCCDDANTIIGATTRVMLKETLRRCAEEQDRLRAELADKIQLAATIATERALLQIDHDTLRAELAAARELLREAREELTLWMYHGHGSKTSGYGSAPLCNKIDAALKESHE